MRKTHHIVDASAWSKTWSEENGLKQNKNETNNKNLNETTGETN